MVNMCYNFRVKSKALFTISLCAAFAAAGAAILSGTTTASAATAPSTHYPTNLTGYVNDNLEGFVDFATDGDSFAFADRNGITVVENGERTKYDIKNVSALDYYDSTYYYKLGPACYSLSTLEQSDNDKFLTDYSYARLNDGSQYKIHTDAKCYYLAENELNFRPIEISDECTKLKVYNNIAYAFIKSSESSKITVKKLDGTTCEDVNPSYIDFTDVEKVALGTIKSSLGSYNLDKLHFAKLEYGKYYSEININNVSGEYFDADRNKTYRCGDEGAISADEIMLVLGESGSDTTVFTHGGKCYIAYSEHLKTDDYTEQTSVEEAEFTNAYVNAPDWIYSSPYLCGATKAVKLTAGDAVRVTGKISTEIIGLQFYKVEFGEEDEKATGYVLSGLLKPYTADDTEHPDDKNFGVINDPYYSEDDLVKIVVLLLIVIALVLIGLTYITYVLTSKKRKALKQAESEKTDADEDKKE